MDFSVFRRFWRLKNKANQSQFWQPESLNIRGKADRLLAVGLSGAVE